MVLDCTYYIKALGSRDLRAMWLQEHRCNGEGKKKLVLSMALCFIPVGVKGLQKRDAPRVFCWTECNEDVFFLSSACDLMSGGASVY